MDPVNATLVGRWSPDGEQIAYLVAGDEADSLWTVQPDGNGARKVARERDGIRLVPGQPVTRCTRASWEARANWSPSISRPVGNRFSSWDRSWRSTSPPTAAPWRSAFGRGHMGMGLAAVEARSAVGARRTCACHRRTGVRGSHRGNLARPQRRLVRGLEEPGLHAGHGLRRHLRARSEAVSCAPIRTEPAALPPRRQDRQGRNGRGVRRRGRLRARTTTWFDARGDRRHPEMIPPRCGRHGASPCPRSLKAFTGRAIPAPPPCTASSRLTTRRSRGESDLPPAGIERAGAFGG